MSLFETFYIDLSVAFPLSAGGYSFLLVFVEHLSNFPVAMATNSATDDTLIIFLHCEVMHRFRLPLTILSDKAACVTARDIQEFM